MDNLIASPASSPALPPTLRPPRETSSPPSSPLSEFSKTPSPPSSPSLLALDPSKRYPSPCATSQSGGASPRKMDRDADADADGPPPAKRRRVQPPPKRPRMTRHLDLNDMASSDACEEELGYLIRALRTKKKIVVIAGAGISVSAGIPDFRSSTGLFTTLRGQHGLKGSGKHLFDASVYKHDSSTSSFHSMVRELAHMTDAAVPTPFHHMLASIAHEGRLMRLYSQNVDCIDTKMPPLATNVPLNVKGPWPTTVQLHGGLAKMVCSKCGQLEDFDGSLFDGPEAPACSQCTVMDEVRTAVAGKRSHGIGRLRPRIVLYNEYNPDEEAIGMVSKADLRRGADAVIVVGTSLKIPGVRRLVKELCHTTRSRRDGFTAWINVDPEPQGAEFKDCWDLIVRGSSDDVASLTGLPHWDAPDVGSPSSWGVTGDEDLGSLKLEVVLEDRSPAKPRASKAGEKTTKKEPSSTPRKALPKSPSKAKTLTKSTSSPTAAMPTPISSPKPARKRLPEARQSKLPFQQVKKGNKTAQSTAATEKQKDSKPPAAVKKAAVASKLPTAAKKERHALPASKPQGRIVVHGKVTKAKKEEKAPTKSIALTFRATKHIPASTPEVKKRKPLPSGKSPEVNTSGKRAGCNASVVATDVSGLSDVSDLSSPPESIKRQLSADFSMLPSLRDSAGSSPLARDRYVLGKENRFSEDAIQRALDNKIDKIRQPSSLSLEHPTPRIPPSSSSRRGSDAKTISPGSVPHGMTTLID
ncbi:uncharacterized protein SPSK_05983 [Sporothrix schenckii 1099-18]|uniref:Deacetylase sirtuin-type domain-containing protein n=1 Tax=Sporothrix schenckii 1099-18 TaxID=1397361 RepID=A0A0F2MM79_SPOSC|nr:uncharacterized protein SPSK_05983 [Sporothrix schenckii 1099-18]KJR89930.1 hypothetical protein SPSK_05983 [Sporothrix schenckii 1099-18]